MKLQPSALFERPQFMERTTKPATSESPRDLGLRRHVRRQRWRDWADWLRIPLLVVVIFVPLAFFFSRDYRDSVAEPLPAGTEVETTVTAVLSLLDAPPTPRGYRTAVVTIEGVSVLTTTAFLVQKGDRVRVRYEKRRLTRDDGPPYRAVILSILPPSGP